MTRKLRGTLRRAASLTVLAGMATASLGISVTTAPAAFADNPREVCDICSSDFDSAACDALGYLPYDSVEQPEGPNKKPSSGDSGGSNNGSGSQSGNNSGSSGGGQQSGSNNSGGTSAPKPKSTPTAKSKQNSKTTKSSASKSAKNSKSAQKSTTSTKSSGSTSSSTTTGSTTTTPTPAGTTIPTAVGDDATEDDLQEVDEFEEEELVEEYIEEEPAFEQPVAPAATVVENSVTVTWTQVVTTEQVDGYIVSLISDEGLRESYVAPGVTEHTFAAVPQGAYTATIALYGPAGQSDASQPSAPIVVESTLRTVPPSIGVSAELASGATVTISGGGLDASLGDVRVELHSDPIVLGTGPVAADGSFSFTVTLPESVVAGEHSLVAFQGDVEVVRTAVTVPAPVVVTSTTQIAGIALLGALAVLGAVIFAIQLGRGRRQAALASQSAPAEERMPGDRPAEKGRSIPVSFEPVLKESDREHAPVG